MKILIKTAGNLGKELQKLLQKRLPEVEVIGYTDNDCTKWGGEHNGMPIFSPIKSVEMIKAKLVDMIIIPMKHQYLGVRNMFFELNGLGIPEENIKISSVNIYDLNEELNIDNAFIRINDFNYISLGYKSTLKCNLNCKKCSAFSPLYKNDYIDTFEDFKKQILCLKRHIPHIYAFTFLGGEPLLQNDLCKCINFFRRIYSLTNIFITTNGILLKKLSEEQLKILHDCNVTVIISPYPVMFDKIEGIVEFLKSKNIKVNIADFRIEFSPILCDKHNFPYESLENICSCYTLYRGGLASCSEFFSMKKYNETFGVSYEYRDGIVDIFDENLKASDIMPRLIKPSKLCNFCALYKAKSNSQPVTSSINFQTSKWDYYKVGEQPKAEDWF